MLSDSPPLVLTNLGRWRRERSRFESPAQQGRGCPSPVFVSLGSLSETLTLWSTFQSTKQESVLVCMERDCVWCMLVCADAWGCASLRICLDARGWLAVEVFISYFWDSLAWDLRLTILVSLAGQGAPGILLALPLPVLVLQEQGNMASFHVSARDPHSGCPACVTSTSCTETSLQPWGPVLWRVMSK